MASYMANYGLNIAADALSNRTITVMLHTGAPGNAGTANQITGAEVDVAASGWTTAASGASETSGDTDFGVLSTSISRTVSDYSLWDGNNFIGWGDMSSNVVVAANESFTLNSGTVSMEFARP